MTITTNTPSEKLNDSSLEQREDTTESNRAIDVPDGGYGWVVVFALFLFNISTWASNSAFSIYLAYYLQHNEFEGGSKLDYAAVGGFALGAGLFSMPLIMRFRDLTSMRVAISVGAVFQFAGTMLAAFSTKLWQIYLTQGLMIGIGLAMIFGPSMIILPQWFREKRTLAQALASAGSGAGGVMFNLAMQHIIKTLSLRWALIIQSIICAVCTTIGIILIRNRDKHVKIHSKIWDWQSFFSFGYLLMTLYVALTLLGYVVLLYNLADFTISLGYTASQGSIVSCMVAVGNFFGRPTVGRLCDKFGTVTTNIFAHLIVSVLCFAMWIPARNYATAIVFALIQGALMGSIWISFPTITARVFGLRKVSTVSSMLFNTIGISGIISPIIAIKLRGTVPPGQNYDPTQYRNPAIYTGCCYFGSIIVLWILRCYLLARDEVAETNGSHEDNDELHIKVTWKKMTHKAFALPKNRKT